MTRRIQEELRNVSNLVELHESNLTMLKDYEVQLVKYYQELLTTPDKESLNPPKPPSRTQISSSFGADQSFQPPQQPSLVQTKFNKQPSDSFSLGAQNIMQKHQFQPNQVIHGGVIEPEITIAAPSIPSKFMAPLKLQDYPPLGNNQLFNPNQQVQRPRAPILYQTEKASDMFTSSQNHPQFNPATIQSANRYQLMPEFQRDPLRHPQPLLYDRNQADFNQMQFVLPQSFLPQNQYLQPTIFQTQYPGMIMQTQEPIVDNKVEAFEQGLNRCTTCSRICKLYARKMCTTCYYQSNRLKKCTKCRHAGTRPHYSKGMCRKCYLTSYYMIRKGQEPKQDNLSAKQHTIESKSQNNFQNEEESPLKASKNDSVCAERSISGDIKPFENYTDQLGELH